MSIFNRFRGTGLRQKLPQNLLNRVLLRLGDKYEDFEHLVKKFGLLDSPVYQRINEMGNASEALDTQAYFLTALIYAGILEKPASHDVREVIRLLRYSLIVHEQDNPSVIGLASLLIKAGLHEEAKSYVSKALVLMGSMLKEEAVPIGFSNKARADEAYNELFIYAEQDLLESIEVEVARREKAFGINESILAHVRGLYMWSNPELHFLTNTKRNIDVVIEYFSLVFVREARLALAVVFDSEQAIREKLGDSFLLILRGQAASCARGDKSGVMAPEMSLRRYW